MSKNTKFSVTVKRISVTVIIILTVLVAAWGGAVAALKAFVYPTKYLNEVATSTETYGLERNLIFAVIKVESGFDKNALSGAGAVGLMQITPATAEYIAEMKDFCGEYDLTEPDVNIDFGCYYLKYLLLKFKTLDVALCAYNAGEGNVRGWLNDKDLSADGVSLKKIPFKETREYVEKIYSVRKKYAALYG